MDRQTELPAAGFLPADSDRQSVADQTARRWLWALPAAVVGAVALLLIVYGQFVQPRLLPAKYSQHLTLASREYAAAVSADNPGRTVDLSLTLLRRTRLAYQRLFALRPDDRAMQLAHGQFTSSAAVDLRRWLHRDRGYLRPEERERMQAAVHELSAESSRLMRGLLTQRDEHGDQAAVALAEQLILTSGPAADRSLLADVRAYAAREPQDASLVALAAAADVAMAGSLPAATTGAKSAFRLNVESLADPRRETAYAARVLTLLRVDPQRAYAEAEERVKEGQYSERQDFKNWNDRVARLQILCVAGKWDEFEAAVLDAVMAADTAEEAAGLRRRVADACLTALQSELAVAEPAWAAECDRAQNMVLQLDSGRPDAAAVIEPICKGEAEKVPPAIVQTLSQSELSPLREVLKSLYLALHAAPDAAAAAVVPGGEAAVHSLCQLSLQIASRSPADAEPLENLMQSLTKKRQDSGIAWYTLAFLQSRHEDRKPAVASLKRARDILGPAAAVEALARQLEGYGETVQ